MSTIELELARTPSRPIVARLLACIAGWRKRRAQRLALADLMALSPHLLADMGVTHEDIVVALAARQVAGPEDPRGLQGISPFR